MAITASGVKSFAPETASLADALINVWIGWAPGAVDPDVFGSDADQAQMLWVCHNLVRSAGGASGTAGPVTQREVGDVRISNAGSIELMDYHFLKSTAYGQALYILIQRYTAGGVAV